jgi:hypothetical protein
MLLVLEDNSDRIGVMRAEVDARLPDLGFVHFADVSSFIAWADANLLHVALISLDHDLEMIAEPNGTLRDPGDGRQVAAWLASQRPSCPVIIHTTNSTAAESMRLTLEDGGWSARRAVPGPELTWITRDWLAAVRAALGRD